ncbi:MAG: VacJ family lipoprotein [Rhodospirillales bacterium]|nr:VacJ family lipoprotein [Rhodospirillales bacterium]
MRAVFAFNQALDTLIVKPLAEDYLELPEQVWASIHNFLQNLRTPVVLFNDVMHGNGERAGTTVARVALNTTLGIGGLFDPATAAGYPRHSEDFGQTLAVWGVDEGPYIVWPILGPSNPRDTVGFTVDFFTDPLNVWTSFAEY